MLLIVGAFGTAALNGLFSSKTTELFVDTVFDVPEASVRKFAEVECSKSSFVLATFSRGLTGTVSVSAEYKEVPLTQ